MADKDSIDIRRRYVEAWNRTMVSIWQSRITELDVVDTGALWHSVTGLPVRADGRFFDITLSQSFVEYGIWQELGVGREVPRGNPGKLEGEKRRQRKKWFSGKYYSSVMNLRDFMAESVGYEFRGLVCNALDTDTLRRNGLG